MQSFSKLKLMKNWRAAFFNGPDKELTPATVANYLSSA